VLAFSGAAFADSISDVFFVSGRVTASGFPAMITVEEGGEPFTPIPIPINGMIKGVNGMPPMLAVMLLDKNNTASDVIFTEMINGVEALTFCHRFCGTGTLAYCPLSRQRTNCMSANL
jgi:hypothetical protein